MGFSFPRLIKTDIGCDGFEYSSYAICASGEIFFSAFSALYLSITSLYCSFTFWIAFSLKCLSQFLSSSFASAIFCLCSLTIPVAVEINSVFFKAYFSLMIFVSFSITAGSDKASERSLNSTASATFKSRIALLSLMFVYLISFSFHLVPAAILTPLNQTSPDVIL